MVAESIKLPNKYPTILGYPTSIFFIISNEFCERFNYYGMRTILALYMSMKLQYDEDTSTVLFHMFTCLVYIVPLIGAIVSDSFLGKFKTILYLSFVYVIGSTVITVGSLPDFRSNASILTVVGLLLIAIGTGGIKPCVSAFGGDQFRLPEQAAKLATFFSLFYFSINAGALISTTLTPIFREDVHCFGDQDCFPLAFGVPGALMIISLVIFVAGKSMYIIKKPTGNTFLMVSKCITNAVKLRFKDDKKKEHWLDYSEQKYGKQLVDDVKILMSILVLFLPLPVFWALFDQQGSRWTFQATQMDGDIGFYTIKPDQMQVVNPLLILILIPVFDTIVYPLMAKIGIKSPLQKLTTGGFIAGIAFLVSGFLELQLEKTYVVTPELGEAQLRLFNGMNCDYNVSTNIPYNENFVVKSLGDFELLHVSTGDNSSYNLKFSGNGEKCFDIERSIQLTSKSASSILIRYEDLKRTKTEVTDFKESLHKSRNGYANVRVLANTNSKRNVEFRKSDSGDTDGQSVDTDSFKVIEIVPADYDIIVDGKIIGKTTVKAGGIYSIVLNEITENKYKFHQHIIAQPNSVNMLWLIPQYVLITAGEVMFSVTGLEFSFTQAPRSMKAVIQAVWLLTVAFGNAIVVIIAEARFFSSQAYEFFLFSVLMFLVMGVFILLAIRYKYREPENNSDSDEFALDNSRSLEDDSKGGITNEGFKNDS